MRVKAAAVLAFLIGTATNQSDVSMIEPNLRIDNLYACFLFPHCDQEIYSPISKPKDTKTETQDVKDEKLA